MFPGLPAAYENLKARIDVMNFIKH